MDTFPSLVCFMSLSHTGLFRVRGKIQHPNIFLIDGPILKPFEVVIDHSHWFCFVYLDGLHVGNYPSIICHEVWTEFGPFGFFPEIRRLSRWRMVISISHNHGHGKKTLKPLQKTVVGLCYRIVSIQWVRRVVSIQCVRETISQCCKISPNFMAYYRGVVSHM